MEFIEGDQKEKDSLPKRNSKRDEKEKGNPERNRFG